MTKDRLEQLRALHMEVESLAGGIIKYMPRQVADTVTGCTPDRIDKHVIPIKGIDEKAYTKLEMQLTDKPKKLMGDIYKAEQWLESVRDTKTRTMLRPYYFQRNTQEEVAEKMKCDVSTVKRNMKKFFDAL